MTRRAVAAVGRGLTEADIQRGLADLLRHHHFRIFHTRFALGSERGFPDLFAGDEDGAAIVIECKGPLGRLSDDQRDWIARFRKMGGVIFAEVVGPTDTADWIGYETAIARLTELLNGPAQEV